MLASGLWRGIFLWLAMATVGMLSGCAGVEATLTLSPEDSTIPGSPVDLDGSEWILAELNGASLLPGTSITLSFEEARAGGFAGCNAYGGTYEIVDEGSLSISMLQRTLQACLEPEGVMEREDAYLAALQCAAAYRVEDDRLEIEDETGEVVLVFEQMDGRPVVSPEPAMDECSGYLNLSVSTTSGDVPTVVTSYQCGSVHVDSTGQSPGPASLSLPAGTPLRLHFAADVPPDSVAVRVYAGTGVSASFFRWPEELPGGVAPVVVFEEITGQSLEIQSPLPAGEYSVVIRAAWDSDIEVFYAFSFRIG